MRMMGKKEWTRRHSRRHIYSTLKQENRLSCGTIKAAIAIAYSRFTAALGSIRERRIDTGTYPNGDYERNRYEENVDGKDCTNATRYLDCDYTRASTVAGRRRGKRSTINLDNPNGYPDAPVILASRATVPLVGKYREMAYSWGEHQHPRKKHWDIPVPMILDGIQKMSYQHHAIFPSSKLVALTQHEPAIKDGTSWYAGKWRTTNYVVHWPAQAIRISSRLIRVSFREWDRDGWKTRNYDTVVVRKTIKAPRGYAFGQDGLGIFICRRKELSGCGRYVDGDSETHLDSRVFDGHAGLRKIIHDLKANETRRKVARKQAQEQERLRKLSKRMANQDSARKRDLARKHAARIPVTMAHAIAAGNCEAGIIRWCQIMQIDPKQGCYLNTLDACLSSDASGNNRYHAEEIRRTRRMAIDDWYRRHSLRGKEKAYA